MCWPDCHIQLSSQKKPTGSHAENMIGSQM